MNIYYKNHRIKTWFVTPIGFTFKVQRDKQDVYIGSGESEIYKSPGEAIKAGKYIVDHKLKGLRICKIATPDHALMVRTDADNHEINTLLKSFTFKTKEWINKEIVDYLNQNLTTGTVENITKEE